MISRNLRRGASSVGFTRAAVGDKDGIVTILNIADASNLTLLGSLNIGSGADVVALAYNSNLKIVYAGLTSDINAVDVTNPASMSVLATNGSSGVNLTYDELADVIYTADAPNLRSMDVSVSTAITNISTLGSYDPRSAAVLNSAGTVLYITDSADFYTIDVSNPASMTLLDSVLGSGWNQGTGGAQGYGQIAKFGNYILVPTTSAATGLGYYDVSNPAVIVQGSAFVVTIATVNQTLGGVVVDATEQVAFVCGVTSNVLVAINISTIGAMSVISSVSLSTGGIGVGAQMTYDADKKIVYVAKSNSAYFVAIDVSNTSSMVILDNYVLTANCSAIVLY